MLVCMLAAVLFLSGCAKKTGDDTGPIQIALQAPITGDYAYEGQMAKQSVEVATELIRILNLSGKVKLTPVGSDFFKEIYFAERPPCERLVKRKLNIRNINVMRDWREALKDYIDNYYKGYLY